MEENIPGDRNVMVRLRREAQLWGARKSLSLFILTTLVLFNSFYILLDCYTSASTMKSEFEERGMLRISEGTVDVIDTIWVEIRTRVVTKAQG